MTAVEEAAAALQSGAYDEANRILEDVGAGKVGAMPLKARALWAITQIMRMHFTAETAEAILEIGRRIPNRDALLFEKMLSAVGPLELLLKPRAAQEVRLRVGGFFLRRGGSEAEAPPWLSAACAADPDDAVAAFLEANARFVLYAERQALRDMEASLEKAAADEDRSYLMSGRTEGFFYHLGHAHERIENLEEAASYYTRATEINPANDIPRFALGGVLMRLGRYAEAVEHLSAVNQHATDYIASARMRAVALFRLGKSDEAIALLQELAELDPLGAMTFLDLGQMYIACDDLTAAEVALARAFRTDPALPGLKSAIITLERLLARHMDPDAGLPTLAEFTIPEQFTPRPDDPGLSRRPDLHTALTSYTRVVRALIVRDVLALYSHSGMGYFWALLHPLVFVAAIAAVYVVVGHKAPFGTSTFAYLAAGIVPFVCFYVRVQTAVTSAVRGNVGLLYFRQVTPLALISAATLREFLTSLVVFVVIAGGIAMFDKTVQISDPLTILVCLVGITMIGVILGTLFGLGELAYPSLSLLEIVVSRVMLFSSGALYYANYLPAHARQFALMNPMLHFLEFIRDSIFVAYVSRYANWQYPLGFVAIGTVLVTLLLYSSRRFIVAQ